MSHDTDKLIRQLSLVAFLMAERRPLTARDVKQNVEGYQEMSDEAFARRFYSDRAELLALGVPLDSQRDEFTGEELYTLRSERYFLPPLELTDEELAALQTCLYLLEGQFAYAEPLRLALQNLALGRPGFEEAPTEVARAVELRDPGYSPELPGRLAKLEGAISKNRTVKFTYWSIGRDDLHERTLNPYSLLFDRGQWYVVGLDLDDEKVKTFRVARIRGEIRLATRRERDFRLPPDFDADEYRLPPPWQVGEIEGEARVELVGDAAWWVERAFGQHGRIEDDVFVTEYSDLGQLSSWILRQDGRAVPVAPPELRRLVRADLKLVQERHEGKLPRVAAEAKETDVHDEERPASPVPPERFGLLQALLAYLLDRCGDDAEAVIPAADIVERFHIPAESLEEHLQLLNLVNFGGGCYAVYTELRDGEVHVDKEIFGDTFRSPPRLTPLEARAIRLALEFVGPMIAADAHTPLARVRRKLEETFGEFDLAQTAEPRPARAEEKLVGTLSDGIRRQRLVEIEYQKEGEETLSTRVVEPHLIERELPHWYIHTWDRTRDAQRSFRLDRMRSARLLREGFEPREGFRPERLGGAAVSARIWYSKKIGRFKVEEGARPLTDGAAVRERSVGSEEWLVGEILADRGEAVLLEPEDLRKQVARRARSLARELRVSRVAAKA